VTDIEHIEYDTQNSEGPAVSLKVTTQCYNSLEFRRNKINQHLHLFR